MIVKAEQGHEELVKRAMRWLLNSQGCSVAFSEFATAGQEVPDAIGWQSTNSILVECKVSRSDFIADQRKPFRQCDDLGMGRERYYMTPPGLIAASELPPRWGLVEARPRHVRIVRRSERFDECQERHEIAFLVSMLRRTQVRLPDGVFLSDWLRYENRHTQLQDQQPTPSGRAG